MLTCRHCVGASSGYQLRFTSEGSDYFYPLSLELTRHPLSLFKETEARLEARQRIVLKTVGLPILDLVTTIDFDDAAGVILLGSCRGQISLVQFDESLQKKGGLLDDLPAVRRGSPDVPRVSLPLPLCSELVFSASIIKDANIHGFATLLLRPREYPRGSRSN